MLFKLFSLEISVRERGEISDSYLDGWNRESHPMARDEFGVWSVTLAKGAIPHNSKVKISMVVPSGERIERIPAYIKRATQDLEKSPVYEGIYWDPPQKYKFKNKAPSKPTRLKIYESHGLSPSLLHLSSGNCLAR
jgi:1,4-alpha-glucan branching enzyme